MPPQAHLGKAMLSYIEKYDSLVSAAGIRYGSVAYIAFGKGVVQQHTGRAETTKYPIEIEFGADSWKLIINENTLVDSGNSDQDLVRKILTEYLVEKKLTDIRLDGNESIVEFASNIFFISKIFSDPASGFLYSFQAENEPAWETVDGVLLQK